MRYLLGVAALALMGCKDVGLNPNCTDEGPRYSASPDTVSVEVGREAHITVTATWCSGHRSQEVFPTMTSADPTIASVNTAWRVVQGQAAGTTTVSLSDGYAFYPSVTVIVH